MDGQVGINSLHEINSHDVANGINGVSDVNSIAGVHSGQQSRKRVVVVGLGMVGIAFM